MESRSTARRIAAVAVLGLVTACQDAPDPTGPAPRADRAPVAQDRIEALFQRVSPEVMALPGTVFSDNDETIGRVVIGIDNVGAARGVRQAMARLGVAEADYAVELTPKVEFKATLRDRFTSGQAGMQVHFSQYVCSVGANVTHVGTGTNGFIINSHCTATQGGVENTLYYQPSSSLYPTSVAIEVADPVYQKNISGCPKGKKCRYSDAARSVYHNGYAGSHGTVARTTGVNTGSLTIDASNPTFTITAQDDNKTYNKVNQVVNKVGRTTGWTQAPITRTCVNTGVSGSQVYLFCQTWVQHSSATIVSGGDSGSGVWVDNGTGVTLIGLLWGGTSDNKTFIFSPLAQVQQELGAVDATR